LEILDPPSFPGAENATLREVSSGVIAEIVGALGADACGVPFTEAEAVPEPTELTARKVTP
jgi:hypothetical protein